MKRQLAIGFALLAFAFGGPCLGAEGQKAVVIHAGQLFDGKSDQLLSNQVIVIQGDRIAEVGPAASVKTPAGAEEINLATGTVLPGLIESHNHMFKIGDYPGTGAEAAVPRVIQPGTPFSTPYITLLAAKNARLDLMSGFTTARDLSSGGTADVDLRNAINEGSSRARGWSSRPKACGDRSPGRVTSTWWTRHGKDASKCGCSSRMERILSRFT
jgi:imidazolonepropionase-like amidohydrolase